VQSPVPLGKKKKEGRKRKGEVFNIAFPHKLSLDVSKKTKAKPNKTEK
jgi:hypothetical protein